MNNEATRSGAYADLPGVKLWFIDSGGAGVPIVLLHPNTGTVAIWQPQISAFAQAGYRVIALTAEAGARARPIRRQARIRRHRRRSARARRTSAA